MADSFLLNQAVTALSRYFVGDATLGETLTSVTQVTQMAVPQAEFVGISMDVSGQTGTYVFTDPEISDIDRVQYETGDGPCVRAFRTGQIVQIPSTREPGDFPKFKKVARSHGIGSTLSVPMNANNEIVGALNLYARDEHAFSDTDVRITQSFATQAAFLLVNTKAYWDARTLSDGLAEAMKSRAEIEQAKGIIMATTGLDADAAFAKLVAQSQHENIKVRELAEQLVRQAVRSNKNS